MLCFWKEKVMGYFLYIVGCVSYDLLMFFSQTKLDDCGQVGLLHADALWVGLAQDLHKFNGAVLA